MDLFDIFSWIVSLYLPAIRHHDPYSFDSPIHVFHADSAGEYISSAHRRYLADLGTLAHFSCPGAHAQNGIIERKHHHILETARALLISTDLAPHF